MTKPRIIFNRTLRAWEIVGMGLAYDDLPTAIGVAIGYLFPTNPRPTDMADALAYTFAGRRGSANG